MSGFTSTIRPRSLRAYLCLAGPLCMAILLGAFQASAQTWPADGDWTSYGADPAEDGPNDDNHDVRNTYYVVQGGYLYLRMENYGPAGWSADSGAHHARYKWFFDTTAPEAHFSGNHIRHSDRMLLVEDYDYDYAGAITFIDSGGSDGDYNSRWDSTSPPRYVTNTPVGAPFPDYQRVVGTYDAPPPPGSALGLSQGGGNGQVGYRVNGVFVDMYIRLALVGDASTLRMTWMTDREGNNLDMAPTTDHPDTQVFSPLYGTLTIEKAVNVGDGSQNFGFALNPAIGGVTNFSLDDDADPALDSSRTFSSLNPGTYEVAETLIAGWNLASLACMDTDPRYPSTINTNTATGTASVTLDPGSNVMCTYVNNAQSAPSTYTLTVIKDAYPHSASTFEFTLTGRGNFVLTHPANDTASFVMNEGSAYSLAELAVAGWSTTLSCTDPSVIVSGAQATIPNTITGDVTCTYTNTQQAGVIIAKEAPTAPGIEFTFTENFPAGGDTFILTPGQQQPFTGLAPGTYAVTEDPLPGYALDSIVCSDTTDQSTFNTNVSTRTATLNVAAGANVTCTFSNREGVVPGLEPVPLIDSLRLAMLALLLGGLGMIALRRRQSV